MPTLDSRIARLEALLGGRAARAHLSDVELTALHDFAADISQAAVEAVEQGGGVGADLRPAIIAYVRSRGARRETIGAVLRMKGLDL